MNKQGWMVALAIAIGMGASPAGAQDASATSTGDTAPIQVVAMRGVRDPAMMPYERAYRMLAGIRQAGQGRLQLRIRVLSAHRRAPIPGLVISLEGDSLREHLALSEDGFLEVPLREDFLRDNAVFLTNQKKGSLVVEYLLVPVLPSGTLRYRDLADSIAAARAARAEIIPWYLRPFVPAIKEIRVCYPHKSEQLTLLEATPRMVPADMEQTNMLNKETVWCAAFGAAETAQRPDTSLAMRPGWIALYN